MVHDEAAHLGTTTYRPFETEGLVGTEAVPAVLALLFHPVEDPLDGAPIPHNGDEGWLALDDDGFAGLSSARGEGTALIVMM